MGSDCYLWQTWSHGGDFVSPACRISGCNLHIITAGGFLSPPREENPSPLKYPRLFGQTALSCLPPVSGDMDGELCWPQPKHCARSGDDGSLRARLWKSPVNGGFFYCLLAFSLMERLLFFSFFFLRVWEHAVLKCNLKTSHHYIAARKGYSGEKENTPVWTSW